MSNITCTLTNTTYTVVKTVKYCREMPKCADYYATAYNGKEPVINIYRTPAGKLYAKHSSN